HRVTRELRWRELHGTFSVRMFHGDAFQLQTGPQALCNEARLLLQDLHDPSTDITQANKPYLNGLPALPVPPRVMRLRRAGEARAGPDACGGRSRSRQSGRADPRPHQIQPPVTRPLWLL